MGVKLALRPEAAQELHNLAEKLTSALDNIATATSTVNNVYQSVSEDVGPHAQQFEEMLMRVKNAQEKMAGCMDVMVPCITNTAQAIEEFLSRNPSI